MGVTELVAGDQVRNRIPGLRQRTTEVYPGDPGIVISVERFASTWATDDAADRPGGSAVPAGARNLMRYTACEYSPIRPPSRSRRSPSHWEAGGRTIQRGQYGHNGRYR